jgi:hypothetical protein
MEHYVSYKDLMFLLGISRNEAKEDIAIVLRKERDEVRVSDEVEASEIKTHKALSLDPRYDKKSALILAINGIGGGVSFDMMDKVLSDSNNIKRGRIAGKYVTLEKFAPAEQVAMLNRKLQQKRQAKVNEVTQLNPSK